MKLGCIDCPDMMEVYAASVIYLYKGDSLCRSCLSQRRDLDQILDAEFGPKETGVSVPRPVHNMHDHYWTWLDSANRKGRCVCGESIDWAAMTRTSTDIMASHIKLKEQVPVVQQHDFAWADPDMGVGQCYCLTSISWEAWDILPEEAMLMHVEVENGAQTASEDGPQRAP